MESDNAKTFAATKKWLESLKNDDDVNNYLASRPLHGSSTCRELPGGQAFLNG